MHADRPLLRSTHRDRFHRLTAGVLLLCALSGPLSAADALPTPVTNPLPGGWSLRTGVFPKKEATASINPEGVFTIEGGGERGGVWVRGTVVEADRARMTAAFVYKAFKGDFILTARRIAFDKRLAHQNCGSGVAVIGDLAGWDTPVATSASDNGDKPVWYRIIRKGDRIGLYEGPDGQRWMASNAGAQIPGTVYAGLYTEGWDQTAMAQYDSVTIEENPKFTYSTTWLGNEFEGGPKNTVNSSMFGLAVAPDGTCITTGANGEQENEMGRYRDGQVLTAWNGDRVGASGNAVVVLPGGRGLVAKRNRVQPFDWDRGNSGGKKYSGKLCESGGDTAIRGLAVYQDEVFVAVRPDNAIVVLDLKDLKEKRRMPFDRPGPLAVDAQGVLWVVEEGWTSGHPYSYPYPKPFRILGLNRETAKQVSEIGGIELPSAICADVQGPSKARLLIADNGQDQQVKIFDVSGTKPKRIGTLGAKGGVYAGTPGQMKPGKLFGLSGVGSDAKGNLYVSTSGYPYRVVIPAGMPNIAQLKAFAPAAIDQPEPEALWTLTCPGFNCMGACWDAKTGDAYIGGLARYAYDAKRGLGKEWQIDGVTADLKNDSDGESLLRTFLAAPDITWIEGERFLKLRERTYKLDKNGNLGRIVRIDNGRDAALREQQEQRTKGAADPYSLEALFGRFPADTPTPTINGNGDQLDWKRWEWVDGQGGPLDGKQQRGEYRDLTALPVEQADAQPPTANSRLDRWHATRKDRDIVIQRRRFTGLKNGVPTWADRVSQFPAPAVFTHIIGLKYQPDRDIMDIAGQTTENPGGHEWQVGEIIRFTNWSTQPTLGVRLVFMARGAYVPWGGEGFWQVEPFIDKPTAWDVAGDIAYVCNRTGAIRAYDLNKGNLIEWMDAGPEVFADSGFFDIPEAVRAYEISPTEHLILRESNHTIRILAHRWNPQGANSGRLPPAPEVWAYPRQGEAELVWGGRTGVGGTVRGYQIYRADSAKGPFKKLALATGPTFRDKRPNGQPAWYRVATVNLVGEGPQSAPICAGAAMTAVKRLSGNGTINADGFDLTTRGNWQGVYGAEAAYLAQDHVPEGVTPLPPRTFSAGWLRGFGPMWRGKNPVSPSDDRDRLQSARVPGMRCDAKAHTWSDPNGEIILSDGRSHILSLFLRKGTIHFSDSETGADLLKDVVVSGTDDAPARYVSYLVSGRFRLFIQAEGCGALFIDPVPTGK